MRWIHRSPGGEPLGDPPFQVVALNDSTFVIRQDKHLRDERDSGRFYALAMLACSVICFNALQQPPWCAHPDCPR